MVKGDAGGRDLRVEDVELTMNEYSGTVGMDRMLKHGTADGVDE